MKIRFFVTQKECAALKYIFRSLECDGKLESLSMSELYPVRGSSTLFRLYIDVEFKSTEFIKLPTL